MKFRNLRADEIDVRLASKIIENSNAPIMLLLYKDARCDMNILDETVGALNWKREHTRDNANCIVSIWDEEKKQWVSKEDTGTESFSEKEKGLASDSFKRACFNWGIGRELYTAPEIKFFPGNFKDINKYTKYKVTHLKIENDKITELKIAAFVNYGRDMVEVFSYPAKKQKTNEKPKQVSKKELAINCIRELNKSSELNKILSELEKNLEDCNEAELKEIYSKLKTA